MLLFSGAAATLQEATPGGGEAGGKPVRLCLGSTLRLSPVSSQVVIC
jgi:hypothetical protein